MKNIKEEDKKGIPFLETGKRFLAYFDVMGFKDFVYRNKHKAVKKRMDAISAIVKRIEEYELNNFSKKSDDSSILEIVNKINESENSDILDISEEDIKKAVDSVFDINSTIIHPVIFSDTVVLVSNSNKISDLFKILVMSSLFIKYLFEQKSPIPIKGAISYGEVTVDRNKNIIFGKPLIDAYELAEQINFYGAIAHNSFDSRILKLKKIDIVSRKAVENILRLNTTIKKVHLKSGRITHRLILWNITNDNQEHINNVIYKFLFTSSGSVRKYVDNSIELYKDIVEENHQ